MARRSRGTGVGRGNGEGSKRTQCQPGMPSKNPKGRPRKKHFPEPTTLTEALGQALMQPVEMFDGERRKTVPQYQAMIEVAMNDYARASLPAKLGMLKYFADLVPAFPQPRDLDREQRIIEVLEEMRREYEESEGKAEMLSQKHGILR